MPLEIGLGPIGVAVSAFNLMKRFSAGGGRDLPPLTPAEKVSQQLNYFNQMDSSANSPGAQEGAAEGQDATYNDLLQNATNVGDQNLINLVLNAGKNSDFTTPDNGVKTTGTFSPFSNDPQAGPVSGAPAASVGTATTGTNPVGSAATEIFNGADNTNDRNKQVQDIFDTAGTPTQAVDQIVDLYGDDQAGATDMILSQSNDRELTPADISDNYITDDGQPFPYDVLIKILQGMPDNPDAADILARAPAAGPDGAFDSDVPVPGTGTLPGAGPAGPAGPAGTGPAGTGPAGTGPAGAGPAGTGPAGAGPAGAGPAGAGPAGAGPGGAGPGTDGPGTDDSCPLGQVRINGECVDIPTVVGPDGPGTDNSCPLGQVRNVNGECVPITSLPEIDGPEVEGPDLPEIGGPKLATGGGMSLSDFFSSSRITDRSTDPLFRKGAASLMGSQDVTDNLIGRLNSGYSDYTGNRFNTGLNADQTTLATMIRNNITDRPGQAIFDDSLASSRGISDISIDPITGASVDAQAKPLQTAGRKRIDDIVAEQFSGTNLDPYMNPYTKNVIDTSLKDIERARQMQVLQNNSNATMAGAYGGDRAALVNAESNRASQDVAARTVADLRDRGFNAAADLYGQDADRSMQAQEANQTADIQTVRDSMALGQDSERMNQNTDLRAAQDNQLNQLRAAQNLLNAFESGTDAYGGYMDDFAGLGDSLDARSQREKDFNFNEFLAGTDYDQDMIDNLIRLFSTAPKSERTEETVDRGLAGDISSAVGAFDDIGNLYNAGKDFLFGGNDTKATINRGSGGFTLGGILGG